MDDVANRLRGFIREEILLGDEGQRLDDDTPLLGGILDSLALTQLVGYIEDEFETEVDDVEITADNFRTIADIERLIRARANA
jgi:acyl carrier protein